MDERVLRLIKQINLEDKYSNYFEGSKLDRVVVYDNDKMWEFIIILNKNIISLYLVEQTSFNLIKQCQFKIYLAS